MRHGDLNNFILKHQHTEAKIISPKKRGIPTEPLKPTEPHYMFCGTLGFCGTPGEEHWSRVYICISARFKVKCKVMPLRSFANL